MSDAILSTPAFVEQYGTGKPVTLFAHGFGGSIRDTRPFGTGVSGTRAFMHFRGHGGRPAPSSRWTYEELAGELRAAADGVEATRALGVSMGAGALARMLADSPDRFEKAAFVLPAVLDGTTRSAGRTRMMSRVDRMVELAARHDTAGIAQQLALREPEEVRAVPAAQAWFEHQAELIVNSDARFGLTLPSERAVDSAAALGAVQARTLVLTHEDDEAHPVEVAEAYAAALPNAELVVLPAGSILWLGRSKIREIINGFLND
ncbi:alpha/beta hydrolase [Saxibacter everestensis]|uniref:Alpha/beta hydrolase n=1 Tax=Saxibacter everestensis TaxID=2909229 RepID=A0ABY8QWE9_9MICO|nr:alpha/beta hydrolase [Brevibacteriaceae bacterium ZFBP1038]